jgi:heme-degrading monooxygenase HmoA
MFAVLFEVHPEGDERDTYFDYAKLLKPELEQIDGFVDNIRYGSLSRAGWILSLSGWRDEKSLVRWRTHARHHDAQVDGRTRILADYHLRVGQLTRDTGLPAGCEPREQRLDETVAGEGTTVTLIDARRSPDWVRESTPEDVAASLGFDRDAAGLSSWDVFDAVLSPGEVILMLSWRTEDHAKSFEDWTTPRDGVRLRRVRVVRDYGMFDRRESPQYYPEVARRG